MEAQDFDYWESQNSVQLNLRLRGDFEKQTGGDPINRIEMTGGGTLCHFSDEYIKWIEERVAELEEQHDYIGEMLNNKTDQLKELREEIEHLYKSIRLKDKEIQDNTRFFEVLRSLYHFYSQHHNDYPFTAETIKTQFRLHGYSNQLGKVTGKPNETNT
jgi:tRNA U34 5-carboxymethylaminomethyl modifying GTPase MnmE/TrmE